jgi:hypothetical protein
MGLKGYGLWVNLIQRAEPHHAAATSLALALAALSSLPRPPIVAAAALLVRPLPAV